LKVAVFVNLAAKPSVKAARHCSWTERAPAARGGEWSAVQVMRLLEDIE
jgi:hypothetical protein